MKLPELKKPDKYIGLYVVDFGNHSGVGFTASEVAELLESEKFKDCKVYKIHNAYPDGRLELKEDLRDIVMISGKDPYAYKGIDNITYPYLRTESKSYTDQAPRAKKK